MGSQMGDTLSTQHERYEYVKCLVEPSEFLQLWRFTNGWNYNIKTELTYRRRHEFYFSVLAYINVF